MTRKGNHMVRQDRTVGLHSTNWKDLVAAKSEWSRRLFPPPRKSAVQYKEGALIAARALIRAISPIPTENVVGVGVGEKISSGKHTGVWAVKFFVRLKYPEDQLERKHRLPTSIAGLPVDVEETGLFRPFTAPLKQPAMKSAMPNPRIEMRPSHPGCSIGFKDPDPEFVVAGTFGALVKDKTGSYILSNNHVLFDEDRLPAGSPIFQPGLMDSGPTNTDQIAELTKAVPLQVHAPNHVDCAIARLLKPSLASKEILFIGAPKGTTDAQHDMTVHKFGRTSGYTAGRISSIETDIHLPYDIGRLSFQSQIIIVGLGGASFAGQGDSGALVLERSSNLAVGLLCGGTTTHAYANHIGDVLQALNVTLA
jgi:hypothetical protein